MDATTGGTIRGQVRVARGRETQAPPRQVDPYNAGHTHAEDGGHALISAVHDFRPPHLPHVPAARVEW